MRKRRQRWGRSRARRSGWEKRFKLRTPIYSETASYGHMGRDSKVVTKTFKSAGREKTVKVKLFPWEDLNALGVVKKAFKL